MALSKAEKTKNRYMGKARAAAKIGDAAKAQEYVDKAAAAYGEVTTAEVAPINDLLDQYEKYERKIARLGRKAKRKKTLRKTSRRKKQKPVGRKRTGK